MHNGDTETCRLDCLSGHIDLLINATPVGMYPQIDEMPVGREILENTEYVFDAVYNPMETKLLKTARECGCKVLGGLSMLVWQAAASHKIWDGSQYTYDEIAALCEETKQELLRVFPLGDRRHGTDKAQYRSLRLYGLRKIHGGKKAFQMTQMEFVDMDGYIEKRAGMKIPDILKNTAKASSGTWSTRPPWSFLSGAAMWWPPAAAP